MRKRSTFWCSFFLFSFPEEGELCFRFILREEAYEAAGEGAGHGFRGQQLGAAGADKGQMVRIGACEERVKIFISR